MGCTALFYVGCEEADQSGPGEIANRIYEVRGVVQEIRKDGDVLVIDHEEIPGFMRQMIMPFKVAKEEPRVPLIPGDEIEFVYEVADVKSWIYRIRKTGVSKEVKLGSADDIPDPEDVPVLTIGDELPDYHFRNQDGKAVSLHQFRGMPLALTFVFTRCPVPDYCPAMMRNFDEVEEILKSDPAAPDQWKLLSVSFDSWHDNPETMKAYGLAFGRDSEKWGLLSTDDCCTINEISGNVGLKFADKDGSFVHNLRTVVLDREGRITRIFTDEDWKVPDLVAELKRLGKTGDSRDIAKPAESN